MNSANCLTMLYHQNIKDTSTLDFHLACGVCAASKPKQLTSLSVAGAEEVHTTTLIKYVTKMLVMPETNTITYSEHSLEQQLKQSKAPQMPIYSPMPKFLGLFSKRGFTTFLASCFLTTAGAGATFLPLAFFPFGCK